MIEVEDCKMFRGIMLISPTRLEPFTVEGDWLYKRTTDCWYCNDRSYPSVICEVLKDETE